MVAVGCVMMRIGMNMRMDNGRPADNMRMRKENHPCIVTQKERYEKECDYFL